LELQLRGITKRFPGVLANDRIDLTVRSGEILGLLGENGAGKTTLMNILYGLYSADEGQVLIEGEVQHFTGPGDAIAAGIGMVHQHFMLVPVFTVAENVVLGVEPTRRMPAWLAPALAGVLTAIAVGSSVEALNWLGWPAWLWALIALAGGAAVGFLGRLAWPFLTRSRGKARRGGSINLREARREVAEISERYGLEVDPEALIEDLPVGVQQRVEIIKVLFREARFLVFDEPTAVLTPQEVQEFFRIVRSLRDAGKGIVFITHKLGEVLEISDRISVLRDGRVVGEAVPGEVDQKRLAEMMVGRPVELVVAKGEAHAGAAVLEVEDLIVLDEREHPAVNGVSFQVRAGEIVGIAGVQGNGQTELVRALTGMRPAVSGSIKVGGREVAGASPRAMHKLGMAHVPEDRLRHGLITSFTVAENMILDCYFAPPYSHGIVMDWGRIREEARHLVEQFDVRTPSVELKAANLSGGNQQKVIVAREFGRSDMTLAIASQPTRGLDVGSIEYIHGEIVAQRDKGAAILIVSSELDEVMALSDRLLVMYRGKIVAELKPEKVSPAEVGLYMAGAKQ
jgi:general nucleoside transport system ATP-binding protein